jgi:hypothetical protein
MEGNDGGEKGDSPFGVEGKDGTERSADEANEAGKQEMGENVSIAKRNKTGTEKRKRRLK